MNEELNKYLTEAMGECWHAWDFQDMPFRCIKCKEYHPESGGINNDFSTWEGFGKLWEWSIKQPWWNDFVKYLDTPTVQCNDVLHVDSRVVNPEIFASTLYDFLNRETNTGVDVCATCVYNGECEDFVDADFYKYCPLITGD